MTPVLCVHVVM